MKWKSRSTFIITLLTLLFLHFPLQGDVIHLKDGRKFEGQIVEESENELRLRIQEGIHLTVKKEDIEQIEKQKSALEICQERFSRAKTAEDFDGALEYFRDEKVENEELLAKIKAALISARKRENPKSFCQPCDAWGETHCPECAGKGYKEESCIGCDKDGMLPCPACSQVEASAEEIPILAEEVSPSVVLIVGRGDERGSQGSGFFVAPDQVVTNYHVIKNMRSVAVTTASGDVLAVKRIVAKDEAADLVTLSVNTEGKHFRPLPLADIDTVRAGQKVVVIGSPQFLEGSVSTGVVSALRELPGFGKIIQITAPISKGSSGSPVLNLNGEVIGIATFVLVEGQNLNFAVSSEKIPLVRRNVFADRREKASEMRPAEPRGRGKKTCGHCAGKGTVKAPCPRCHGYGKFNCSICGGDGIILCSTCRGKGSIKCAGCGGSGTRIDVEIARIWDSYYGWTEVERVVTSPCNACRGTGKLLCPKCRGAARFRCKRCNGKGDMSCERCQRAGMASAKCRYCGGLGYITCRLCLGKGKIICTHCKGTKVAKVPCEHCGAKALIKCPECDGKGIKKQETEIPSDPEAGSQTNDVAEVKSQALTEPTAPPTGTTAAVWALGPILFLSRKPGKVARK